MKKIMLMISVWSCWIYAEISAQEAAVLAVKAQKIRKELGIHTPTAEEMKLERIRSELHLDFDTSSKASLLGQNRANTVQSLVAPEKKKSITDTIRSSLSGVAQTLGLEEEKKNEDYSFSGTLNKFYKTVGLEEGESWGLPSFFGLNKKKETSLFGTGLLGDIGNMGTTIYKGMKYSGQSAEFSSGMIYKSSKMYNTMFGMFEDSPFNVFEEEDEASVFDVFEGGNKVLDIFD